MIKVLIVDDEPLAQDVLETYVKKVPDLHLVGTCKNAIEASTILNKEVIDLLFLDIQMPQLNGIDFLKSLTKKPFVIITTAFSDYAVEGFELNVVDYLLKPISFNRFLLAINRIIDSKTSAISDESSRTSDNKESYFFVKADKKMVKINHKDILYIEGLKDYVIIKLAKSRLVTLQTMKSLEDKLPSKTFKRIHRSYIVNLDKLEAIVGNTVEVKEGDQQIKLPIGKNYKDELIALINENRL
jgi:DNA-binding LytR/AlgR family response regulator